MDQSVMVFAGTAARGSAIPSPSEGMVTYRSDDDVVEVYDGSVFKAVGPGKILQVLSDTKTDAFTTSSLTLVDISALSVSITPSSTASKMWITVNIHVAVNGALSDGAPFYIVRNGTNLVSGSGTLSRVGAAMGPGINNLAREQNTFSMNYLDSPSSTSSLTYGVQTRSITSGQSVFINRSATDTDNATFLRTISTITVMEVAG
jgi:hypothetical protein